MGFCPSGRLFEAAACGTPIVSDGWAGIEEFFEPGEEILIASGADDTLGALEMGEAERARMARSARERTLACHTADVRAAELEAYITTAGASA